ncbi:MAG: GH3 auxin-responsive promoter family protein, partial [Clostridia bacterium]|nr:GH3 auxin-responsive promoter family protein [Clostridia bacterium]
CGDRGDARGCRPVSQMAEDGFHGENEQQGTKHVGPSVAIHPCHFAGMNVEFVGHSYYPDFSTKPPRYTLLAELKGAPEIDEETRQQFIEVLDDELCKVNEKYAKYRRWGMLSRPEMLFLKEKTYWDYRESLRGKGVVLNQIKPVTVINSKERERFFFEHVATEADVVEFALNGGEVKETAATAAPAEEVKATEE